MVNLAILKYVEEGSINKDKKEGIIYLKECFGNQGGWSCLEED